MTRRKVIHLVEYVTVLLSVVTTVDALLRSLLTPWWLLMLVEFPVNLLIAYRVAGRYLGRFGRRRRATRFWVDQGGIPDVFNPHGDGTLRPGDALYDNFLRPLMRGELGSGAMIVRHEGGLFEVVDPGEKNDDR